MLAEKLRRLRDGYELSEVRQRRVRVVLVEKTTRLEPCATYQAEPQGGGLCLAPWRGCMKGGEFARRSCERAGRPSKRRAEAARYPADPFDVCQAGAA